MENGNILPVNSENKNFQWSIISLNGLYFIIFKGKEVQDKLLVKSVMVANDFLQYCCQRNKGSLRLSKIENSLLETKLESFYKTNEISSTDFSIAEVDHSAATKLTARTAPYQELNPVQIILLTTAFCLMLYVGLALVSSNRVFPKAVNLVNPYYN